MRPAPLILAATLLTAPAAGAVDYLGERCWERADGVLVRVGVTLLGDGHFQLAGHADTSEPGVTPLTGAAQLSGGSVYMTLHFTGEDATRIWSGSARAVLDADSLDGTVEVLEVFHLRDDPDPFAAQTAHSPPQPLTSVPCP